MRVLVLGSGGREHALAWALQRDGIEVLAAPGNAGLDEIGRCLALDPTDAAAVLAACREERVDAVIVGPEAPLFAGVAERLRPHLPTLGPDRVDAQLEGSKAFAKAMMRHLAVPTAPFLVVQDEADLDAALRHFDLPVVKADGPFLGKGVVVPATLDEARAAARLFLKHGPVVLEGRLQGPELSLMALVGGGVAILPAARDHKRLGDGDVGPNTGGMGAYAPLPEVTEAHIQSLYARTLAPVLRHHDRYRGVLYAGLMQTQDGPSVLEYNVRFGDPECQAIAPIVDGFGDLLLKAAAGSVPDQPLRASRAAVAVVLAAEGYPEAPRRGDPIEGVDRARSLPGVEVFMAGVARQGGTLLTAGGRVLTVVGIADDLAAARSRAYAGAEAITYRGKTFRSDIASGA